MSKDALNAAGTRVLACRGISDRLRKRAARLFALAVLARANAAPYADAITELASEALAQAEEMERRRAQPDTSDK